MLASIFTALNTTKHKSISFFFLSYFVGRSPISVGRSLAVYLIFCLFIPNSKNTKRSFAPTCIEFNLRIINFMSNSEMAGAKFKMAFSQIDFR